MFKIDNFIAVINPPEVAILAVSSIHKAVIPQDDATSQTREVTSLTLSADHRAVDGSLAAQFLSHIRQQLEEPESL
jgi:pyruvate dehydrogenase E2 component (dihydrolipoamide acetyltransferase)